MIQREKFLFLDPKGTSDTGRITNDLRQRKIIDGITYRILRIIQRAAAALVTFYQKRCNMAAVLIHGLIDHRSPEKRGEHTIQEPDVLKQQTPENH